MNFTPLLLLRVPLSLKRRRAGGRIYFLALLCYYETGRGICPPLKTCQRSANFRLSFCWILRRNLAPRIYEGGGAQRRGEPKSRKIAKNLPFLLPQSTIGSEEPIFDSPLVNAGAKAERSNAKKAQQSTSFPWPFEKEAGKGAVLLREFDFLNFL